MSVRQSASTVRRVNGGEARSLQVRREGGLTSKLRALVDVDGRPIGLRLTGGQVRDACKTEALIGAIPEGATVLGDKET